AGLARAFLAAASDRPLRLSRDALAELERHDWPGNIRELRNVIERAALLAPGDEVEVEHLSIAEPAAAPSTGSLHGDVDALETQRVLEALEASGGNQTRAAQRLGISRGTLLSRLKQYGVRRPRS